MSRKPRKLRDIPPTPVFPIALRGAAALSSISGLLGPFTTIVPPEDGNTDPESDPLAHWDLDGLEVILFLAPKREHVCYRFSDPPHPAKDALLELCAKYQLPVDLLDLPPAPSGTTPT